MKKFLTVLFLGFVLVFSACSKTHTVNITYEPDGGQLSMSIPVDIQLTTAKINSDSSQWYPPTPFKQNYIFVNWYIDSDFDTLYTHEALKENKELTLYARYIEFEQQDFFVVSFVAYGGTFTPNQLIQSGGLLTLPNNPEKQGYSFQYWVYENSLSGKEGEVDFSEAVTENLTLGAFYTNK